MSETDALSTFELSTDGVPPAERFELWRDTALRRLDVEKISDGKDGFEGRMRRLVGKNAEFCDHQTDPISVDRSPTRCRMDGRSDISIALVLDCVNAAVRNIHELTLKSGDLYILDYSAPVHAIRPKHRELALILPRRRVTDVLGDDLSSLAGRRLSSDGICALLSSHMLQTANEANGSSAGCAAAIDVAVEMALAALQTFARGRPDADQVSEGLYISADFAIARYCANPKLSPESIAAMVGCSRASLYRLFARRGRTVAAAIWTARLGRAYEMLVEPVHRNLRVGEIAFRCGFNDQSTFSRMFKRRYGLAPRDAREMNQ